MVAANSELSPSNTELILHLTIYLRFMKCFTDLCKQELLLLFSLIKFHNIWLRMFGPCLPMKNGNPFDFSNNFFLS